MSRFRSFEIVEHSSPFYHLTTRTSIFKPLQTLTLHHPHFLTFPLEDELYYPLDLLTPTPPPDFDTIADLIQIDARHVTRRVGSTDLRSRSLIDRVSALELGFDRLAREERIRRRIGDRKYTWTAEVKRPESERKYQWTAEIKDGKEVEKSCKWTAEIKRKVGGGRSPIEQTYTVKVSSGGAKEEEKKKKTKKKQEGKSVGPTRRRIVEIEEDSDNGGIVLRQVFAKRVEKSKGKRKELSPQDAAILIQKSFRAYLIRRSKALRALRELAIAKTKLKEIRAFFNNFTYRRRLASDAEERQRFTEKIIVLLLTVDAIEGPDLMVRAAKRSMVDELEAMLDVVDPQPPGKSLSMRRRTFDMPDGLINKELAEGVAQVVQILDQEVASSETFEACL